LEVRYLLNGSLTVPLDPTRDIYGEQIVTVQGYTDTARATFGIFDTGAAAVSFSANDEGTFTARNDPIPIKVPGGAVAEGVGGLVVGDVSKPGAILSTGLHAATMSLNGSGKPVFTFHFGAGTATVPGIQ